MSQLICVFVFNVSQTAKVIWRQGPSERLVEREINPANRGLQGKWFIHYITAAPNEYVPKDMYILIDMKVIAVLHTKYSLKSVLMI